LLSLKIHFISSNKKLKYFADYFNIVPEEQKSQLQDELMKLKSVKLDFYKNSSDGNLHFWDRIKDQENLSLIPKIIYFAETLPTTSAGIEQSFSLLKLLKTEKRNQLQDSTLEGLTLVSQEYSDHKQSFINEKIMKLFMQVKNEFNVKKKVYQKQVNIKNIEVRSNSLIHPEESKEQIIMSDNKSKDLSPSITHDLCANEEIFEITFTKKRVGEEDEDVLSEDLLDDNTLYPVEKRVKST